LTTGLEPFSRVEETTMPTATKLSILVAEDESLLRMMATDMFEEAGFKVVEASSGEGAVNLLKAGPVAALFTDVELLGTMDGLQLAWIAHHRDPDAAILVVSGRQLPKQEDMPPGAIFLSKPYDLKRVLQSLEHLIGEQGS
jgi:DNA-binding NtrC family response regulator